MEAQTKKIGESHQELVNLLTPMGKRVQKNSDDIVVLSKVQQLLIVENEEKWYNFHVESKFSNNASSIVSRSSSCMQAPTTAGILKPAIQSCFQHGGAPPFALEPISKSGTFKLLPWTLSPQESRSICGAVLNLCKDPIRTCYGLNMHYDNPLPLREIRSRTQKLVARFLRDSGKTLNGKASFPKGVLTLNGVGLFSEFLTPADESIWPECYRFIAPAFEPGVLSDPPGVKITHGRYFDEMAGIFARGKGLEAGLGEEEFPGDVTMNPSSEEAE
jgi:hypothetical protein